MAVKKQRIRRKNLNGEACYYLGKFYEEGNVTEKSLDDAEHFYKLAVRKHFANGSESLERVRREKEEIRKAEEAKALQEQKEAEELKKQEESKVAFELKARAGRGRCKIRGRSFRTRRGRIRGKSFRTRRNKT